MSIAKSDEIKNLLVSNSELMVTTAYPHTYCRAVPLQTACEIVKTFLKTETCIKQLQKNQSSAHQMEMYMNGVARHAAHGMNQKQVLAYTVRTADRR